MNTILITGGLGFIGSHTAISFYNRGYRVVVVDNLSRPTPNLHKKDAESYNLGYFKTKYPDIEIIIEDVRNKAKINEIFTKYHPDVIIHAAGQTSAVGSVETPENDFDNNVIGLFTTLDAARQVCKTPIFLYLSSNKVYGSGANSLNLKEESTRYMPSESELAGINENMTIDQSTHTPYGVSKLCGDLYVQEYGYLYNMHTIVFRMSCIYGPRQFGFIEQGWVSHLIIDAIHGKQVEIYGNGKQVRDILYIDDLVELIGIVISQKNKELTQNKVKSSEVFNVGGSASNSVSLLEMLTHIENAVGKKISVKIMGWRPADQKYFVCDVTKISKKYNWRPQIPPEKGIKDTAVWLQDHKDLFY
jgi:CDP-paratose 2-epimerase